MHGLSKECRTQRYVYRWSYYDTLWSIFKVVAFQSSTTWHDTFIFLYYRGMFGVHSFKGKKNSGRVMTMRIGQ